jgi:hypothetical protein
MAAQLDRQISGDEFSGLVGWTRPKGVTGAAALKQPSARSGARAHRRKLRAIVETQMSKILIVISVMQPRLNAKPLIFIGIQTPEGGLVQILPSPFC